MSTSVLIFSEMVRDIGEWIRIWPLHMFIYYLWVLEWNRKGEVTYLPVLVWNDPLLFLYLKSLPSIVHTQLTGLDSVNPVDVPNSFHIFTLIYFGVTMFKVDNLNHNMALCIKYIAGPKQWLIVCIEVFSVNECAGLIFSALKDIFHVKICIIQWFSYFFIFVIYFINYLMNQM